jgi:hypothetical protein
VVALWAAKALAVNVFDLLDWSDAGTCRAASLILIFFLVDDAWTERGAIPATALDEHIQWLDTF